VEDNIKLLCPGIANIMMVGDRRKYNVALVTLKCFGATGEKSGTDDLVGPALKMAEGVTTVTEAIDHKQVNKVITDAIKATNSNPQVCQNNSWKIQKFKILPRDFSMEFNEMTPTLKLKRGVVTDNWLDTIEEMYKEE
jgi:long-subunit acyl-CoA synthetase (AMP-forming)